MTSGYLHSKYTRYYIETNPAEDIEKWPSIFTVKVGKIDLAKHLLKEIAQGGLKNKEVLTSRPCIYGVFSGPIGGFSPQPEHCVGCLRCTTEYPGFVEVRNNPDRLNLGDSFFTSLQIDTISYEAQTGFVPVKGAGYRGKFGGDGWDGMWTDMSEIVRPTRDGIHGREYISTEVDIGYRPNFLTFDETGSVTGNTPNTISIPLPMLLEPPKSILSNTPAIQTTIDATIKADTLIILPIEYVIENNLVNPHIVPAVKDAENLSKLRFSPQMILLGSYSNELVHQVNKIFPSALLASRIRNSHPDKLHNMKENGVSVFILTANYHGVLENGEFIMDFIRKVHQVFVDQQCRQEVTLIVSGGVIAAEHIPKALLLGADAVTLDTPLIAAIQGKFATQSHDRELAMFTFPRALTPDWCSKRILNLLNSWRYQLLEISGAMGLREIRRMRGEMGRALFAHELEAEAFEGVLNYD